MNETATPPAAEAAPATPPATEEAPAAAPEGTGENIQGDAPPAVQSTTNDAAVEAASAGSIATGGESVEVPEHAGPTETQTPAEKPVIEYTDFKFPEGTNIDDNVLRLFKDRAKGDELSQEAAQGYIDMYGEIQKAQMSQLTTLQNEWKESSAKDPDIGGDKLKGVGENVQNFIKNALPIPDDQAVMNDIFDAYGLGNHPVVLKAFNYAHSLELKIAELTKDDTLIDGEKPGGAPEKNLAKAMYPDMN